MPRKHDDESETIEDATTPRTGRGIDAGDEATAVIPSAAGPRYEVRELLGSGGMGEVHLCLDRSFDRDVAMKVARADVVGSEGSMLRFAREIRIQGQLEHPAIVPAYDAGTDELGRPFFTMKRVRGETLKLVLQKLRKDDAAYAKQYTRHRLLEAFSRVCLAVDFAHARGVVHRDLKPANVMFGDFGEVYVLDWGVAKVVGTDDPAHAARPIAEPAQSADATEIGDLVGTPGYMAPEQARGESVDARSDVYALGAILFDILALQPLATAKNPDVALMQAADDEIDAHPARRAPEREIPPELDAICARAACRDRDERIASARELGEAVEAFLSGDRSVELRRAAARELLKQAEEAIAADASTRSHEERRGDALQLVGRAVALAPDQPEAAALLLRLLTEPPRTIPAAVNARVEKAARSSQRRFESVVFALYMSLGIGVLATCLIAGVRDWRLASVPIAFCLSSAFMTIALRRLVSRKPAGVPVGPKVEILAAIMASLVVASTSFVYGPVLGPPSFMIVSAISFVIIGRRGLRPLTIAISCVGVLIPILLAWLGLHPAAIHEFDGTRVVIEPLTVFTPRDTTFALHSVIQVVVVLIPALLLGRWRDGLADIERKNHLLTWRLEQLVAPLRG